MRVSNFLLNYLFRFLLFFCLLYFGTLAIIGLASPDGYYSPFISNYLNYIAWLRSCILHTSKALLTLFGYKILITDSFTIKIQGGRGVHLVYSCVGFGVMSFWIAFILANKGKWEKKIKWIFGGLVLIFCINVLRISMFLISINKNWGNILSLDNHLSFNIVAYGLIFIMINFFDRSEKQTSSDLH